MKGMLYGNRRSVASDGYLRANRIPGYFVFIVDVAQVRTAVGSWPTRWFSDPIVRALGSSCQVARAEIFDSNSASLAEVTEGTESDPRSGGDPVIMGPLGFEPRTDGL